MKQNNNIPKGYKDSPLGIIPQDWEVKRLWKIATIFSGGTPKSTENKYYDGDIPFIKSGEIHNELTEQFLSQIGFDKSSAKMVKAGDILYALYGANSGDCAISRINGAINQAVLCIRTKENSYYLFSVLQNNKNYYYNCYLQGGQGNLSAEIVKKYLLAIPPLPEQKKIAEILSLWDEAIEKQTQIIDLLEQRKRGLMQQLLSGKKRLNGFNGEWRKVKAGTVFQNTSVKDNENEVLLSATQENGVIPRDMLETRVTMPTGNINSFKLVEKGDFVISLRSFQGGIEYSNYRGIVSPAYTVLKPKVDINKEFYKYYFKSADFIGHLAIAVIGIRDGKQISYEDFCVVKVPNPLLTEQTAIFEILSTADDEIKWAKQKLDSLQKQKKGLMQVLLTGKKRVRI